MRSMFAARLDFKLFDVLLEMNKSSSSRISKTDWKRVKAMQDRDIKLTPEHPEMELKHAARVIVRKGLKRDDGG